MKINNIKYLFVMLFSYVIACSVVMAHTHVSDVVQHSSTDLPAMTAKSTDMNAKVIGDLHNHIHKTTLKNPADTVAARRNDMEPEEVITEESLLERFVSGLLMIRVMMTLPMSAVTA